MHNLVQVRVRKPVEFVCAALRHFTRDCFLSLEGHLSRMDVTLIPGPSLEPTSLLPRSCLAPTIDFVILPVTSDTLETVCRHILPKIGLKHEVNHVQIASEARIVLSAYDNFHRELVWIDRSIGEDALESMRRSGVIGWYDRLAFHPSPPVQT